MSESIAYLKETGERIALPQGSPLPENATAQPPSTPYDKWDGSAWVFDRDNWLDRFVRPLRDAKLADADVRVRRRDYQLRAGTQPKESEQAIAALLAHMQALRDLPECADPAAFAWPEPPQP